MITWCTVAVGYVSVGLDSLSVHTEVVHSDGESTLLLQNRIPSKHCSVIRTSWKTNRGDPPLKQTALASCVCPRSQWWQDSSYWSGAGLIQTQTVAIGMPSGYVSVCPQRASMVLCVCVSPACQGSTVSVCVCVSPACQGSTVSVCACVPSLPGV